MTSRLAIDDSDFLPGRRRKDFLTQPACLPSIIVLERCVSFDTGSDWLPCQ